MNASTTMKPAQPNPAGRERHVLCVDDDVEFLKSLEFFLPERVNAMGETGLWYRFTFLDAPKKALEALCELTQEGQQVAMLISDQMMPSMKGTEFLASARGLCEESIRVLLTGHAGIESAVGAINERLLDRYLTKPIESEQEFVLSIRQLLEQYEMQFTIRDQRRLIHELYDFANTLNAKEDLQDTLHSVAKFAASALNCERVVVVAGPPGAAVPAAWGWRSPLPRLRATAAARAEGLALLGGSRVGLAPRLEEIPILEPVEGPGPSGAVAFGVLGGEKGLLGAVVAHGPRRGTFDERDLQTLAYIVNTASIALNNQVHRTKLRLAWAETRAQATHLSEANQRLRILDRLKSDFLAFISHELRTPLNHLSAVGLLSMLEDPADLKEAAQIVKRGYERLERFISKALDYFSCLGAEALESTEPTDLAMAVRAVVDEIRAAHKTVDLEITLPDLPCPALIERTMAEEIVRVLLDNAIKFSPENPRVRVILETEGSRIRLRVQDQGRGFPPEWSTEVFQPFTIVESMRHHEGTALSLAKVAAIVGTHGGEIRAESPGLGRGATFIVELPTQADVHVATPDASSDGISGLDEGDGLSERAAA